GWSGDPVRMLRTIPSRPTCSAIFGRYSHTWTPGMRVATGRNGPPVGRPGFMSNVSIWLAPPFIHRRMQRLPCFRDPSAPAPEANSPPQLGTAPAAVTSVPLSRARRLRWSAIRQRGCMAGARRQGSMVEPELGGVQQGPDRLLDQGVRLLV